LKLRQLSPFRATFEEKQMAKGASAAIEHLVNEEIHRLVVDAMATEAALSISECVAKVKSTFPECRLSTRDLSDKILVVASGAGVPLDLDV
jgi:hypothetical protein